jgi:hypothetical protein
MTVELIKIELEWLVPIVTVEPKTTIKITLKISLILLVEIATLEMHLDVMVVHIKASQLFHKMNS